MKNELYHHGILGQKWGKKNGPPYPLDGDQHSETEKVLNETTFEDIFKVDDRADSNFQKALKENGYKSNGDLTGKTITCKNPRGNDQKFDITFEVTDFNDEKKALKMLQSLEKNIEQVDSKARHRIVDYYLKADGSHDSYSKPWKYDQSDAYPKESKMSIAQQRKDMYDNLGTFDLGADRPKGKRYLRRSTAISLYGDDNGLLWYADGGSFYGHEIVLEFYCPNGDASKIEFYYPSMEG